MIASSRWQLLGFSTSGPEWAVSYFKATMFTPAGLDLIVRDPHNFPAELRASIIEAIGRVDDAEIKKLAGEIFEVPHVK